jgi:hypothetical protein
MKILFPFIASFVGVVTNAQSLSMMSLALPDIDGFLDLSMQSMSMDGIEFYFPLQAKAEAKATKAPAIAKAKKAKATKAPAIAKTKAGKASLSM